ncbi:hypothetical protein PsorP6_006846 [Peronosclerospora sorghi]|uniref:Uncharacterized protein n=1 Tax=Peronosclerospora sorghi TaxID=230839 RepID=A0ACC0W9M1_9STRA|nr:hypothetical protein PsorP6_006846 [Peronosclerospora sorghi]
MFPSIFLLHNAVQLDLDAPDTKFCCTSVQDVTAAIDAVELLETKDPWICTKMTSIRSQLAMKPSWHPCHDRTPQDRSSIGSKPPLTKAFPVVPSRLPVLVRDTYQANRRSYPIPPSHLFPLDDPDSKYQCHSDDYYPKVLCPTPLSYDGPKHTRDAISKARLPHYAQLLATIQQQQAMMLDLIKSVTAHIYLPSLLEFQTLVRATIEMVVSGSAFHPSVCVLAVHIFFSSKCHHVLGRWAFPNAAGQIIIQAVAGAEPATVVSCIRRGHTSQVGANAKHHEPLWLLHTSRLRLGIT